MSKHNCKTCNGSGAYKSGLHLIVCPACDGSGDEPQPRSHTPGPWLARLYGDPGRKVRYAITGQHGVTVAEIFGPYPISFDREEEDARLIAAAPDLLAACKAAVDSGQLPERGPTLAFVRAAIAKAEGGA